MLTIISLPCSQVANKADCVKVAVDFVSPENINRCEKLTREFRAQNQAKVWKDDVLQLRSMMWFAWMSFSQQPRLTGPEGDDGGRTEHVVST
jgi:lysine-specific demethylase 3